MTPEEIARRFSKRPGFNLISYRQVALPVFWITIKVLAMTKKQLPPIPEFILRAIGAGLTNPVKIAGFLGLEQSIVNAGLHTLMHNGDIIITAPLDDRRHRIMITRKGNATLAEAASIVPEEQILRVHMDGLTRRLENLGSRPIKPRAVRVEGLFEIPPYPRRKPTVDDININDLRAVTTDVKGEDYQILTILDVERVERFFRDDAFALIYKAVDGTEVQVGFVVDGHLSEEHETAFRMGDQMSRLKLISVEPTNFTSVIKDIVGREIVEMAASPEEIGNLQAEYERTDQEVSELTKKIEEASSLKQKTSLEAQLKEAQENMARIKSAIEAYTVRNLEVYEHPRFLREALENAQERIMIISPWIRAKVVDDEFIKLLEAALHRGTVVYIGYGLDGEGNDRGSPRDQDALKRLEVLANNYANFHLRYFGDTHAKVLICDRRFLIVTSFNWLSFRGDPNLGFRDERGMYVTLPHVIDEQFASYYQRFKE